MKTFGEHPLSLKRQSKPGMFTLTPCCLRRLTMDDHEAALALHRAISQNANPKLFVSGSDEDFLRILEGEGIVLGVDDGKKIVCMRTVLFDTHDEGIPREAMKLLPEQWTRMAFMEYCIVRQEFRGNNLQFLTYNYLESLLWDDFDYFYTTVSPLNVFSLRNVLSYGFYVFQLKECYGGYMRYLFRKNLKDSTSIYLNKNISAPVSDYAAQQAFLNEGKVGYRLARHHTGLRMRFGTLMR